MKKNLHPASEDGPSSLTDHLRRGNLMSVACPSREVMRHITSRWGVLVLIVLLGGTMRFGEIRRAINGVSERMLAQTLGQLEQDGLVGRVALAVVPPHVEYSLTPIGREAAEKVQDLADWVEVNISRILSGGSGDRA